MFDTGVVESRADTPSASATPRLGALLAAAPGPEVIAELATWEPLTLSEADRFTVLEAWEQQSRWVSAQFGRALAAVAGTAPHDDDDWVREEVAVTLRLSPMAAHHRIELARRLATDLRRTAGELAAGRISTGHVAVIVDETSQLHPRIVETVETTVLAAAVRQTPGALRRTVRRAVAAADPTTTEIGHAVATAARAVQCYPAADGMATVLATLPADGAQLLMTALQARAGRTDASDTRSADARRADALVELAREALDRPGLPQLHRRRPQVHVSVDLPTLLGLADNPAHLRGYGPLPASIGRRLAADADWRRLITDPAGRLLDYGRTAYTPPAALVDHLIARDDTCRFPGCPRTGEHCDVDHAVPFDQGGTTDPTNCHLLCRRHHRMKTHAGWRIEPHADGALTWVSPMGARYRLPVPRIPPDG